jgi:hypothetical protein
VETFLSLEVLTYQEMRNPEAEAFLSLEVLTNQAMRRFPSSWLHEPRSIGRAELFDPMSNLVQMLFV